MPLIDVECPNGHRSEVNRPLAMWPATPPCPTCSSSTIQLLLPPQTRYFIDPVVVFRGPDGQYRFPGDANGLSAANYTRQGFERVELRSAADVRRFEKYMTKVEYARASRRVEMHQQQREQRESLTRSELRRLMPSMTEFGRQVARTAMARNDNKPRERAHDPGFHLEAFSYDRSNRDESRDERGRRRRD
jgi:hypothetical protein